SQLPGLPARHLRSYGEAEDGTKLRREAGSLVFKIAVENTDAAQLDCQAQQLFAFARHPNCAWVRPPGATKAIFTPYFAVRTRPGAVGSPAANGPREWMLRDLRKGIIAMIVVPLGPERMSSFPAN